jgi:hypothetical protein
MSSERDRPAIERYGLIGDSGAAAVGLEVAKAGAVTSYPE